MVEGKRMEENIPCKCKHAKAGVTILVSDKGEFKTKDVTGNKRRHLIMIYEPIH